MYRIQNDAKHCDNFSVVLHTKYLLDIGNIDVNKTMRASYQYALFSSVDFFYSVCLLSRVDGQRDKNTHKTHLLALTSASFSRSNYRKMSIDILKVEQRRRQRMTHENFSIEQYPPHMICMKAPINVKNKTVSCKQIGFFGAFWQKTNEPICPFAHIDDTFIVQKDTKQWKLAQDNPIYETAKHIFLLASVILCMQITIMFITTPFLYQFWINA